MHQRPITPNTGKSNTHSRWRHRLVVLVALAIAAVALYFLVFSVATADAHRVYAKPVSKLTDAQLKRELQHARGAVNFFNRSPKGRYAVAINYFGKPCWKLTKFQPARRMLCSVSRRSLHGHAWLMRAVQSRLRPSEYEAAMHWFQTSGAKCVKNREGAWTSRGPRARDGSYYAGGFQADATFERNYGLEFVRRFKARAHDWPMWAQIIMAYRGFKDRGWGPWPKTAPACGLT